MTATATPPVTEAQFARQVDDLATLFGWQRYHTWLSVRSHGGFPDEVLVRGQRLIFAELKSMKGKPTDGQIRWLDELSDTAAEVYLWRPDDIEEITRILGSQRPTLSATAWRRPT